MKSNNFDLVSDAALKETVDAVLAETKSEARPWYRRLRLQLARAKDSTQEELMNREFLEKLWEDDSVASTGMGSVKLGPALDDPSFREWFSQAFSTTLPADEAEVEGFLIRLYKEIERNLRQKCDRVARLKLNRVMCARFPQQFTTIADVGSLQFLHRALGGKSNAHPVHAHLAIKRRLDNLLGPVDPNLPDADLDRLCLPWSLYEYITKEALAAPASEIDVTGVDSLSEMRPLPAAIRRKGLTSIKGYFSTLLELVPLLQDGLSREEFADEVRRSNPSLAPSSVGIVINTVAREFDLCVYDGAIYTLNARGLNLLETRDPDELADHLLTRILGVDYAIKLLESGPIALVDFIAKIKSINPGWTSDFMPRSMITWLTSLDLLEQDSVGRYQLSVRGEAWASRVTWAPESISIDHPEVQLSGTSNNIAVQIPSFSMVQQRIQHIVEAKLVFPDDLVRQLHSGLWSQPLRHFAVLTGISGSGKTQLALNYGLAVTGSSRGELDRTRVIPVQPAWYDSSPLLGYVSPLTQRYSTAPFLDILISAADDPMHPYVVILDEMNLSHPEQYLAPMLSAMETGGWIDLHDLPEDVTNVPQRIRYPANLAIIGTLNMDETTHGLSDKILDRAFTLEFWNINVEDFPGWDRFSLSTRLHSSTKKLLIDLGCALAPVRLHFGWRTVEDVLRYLSFAVEAGSTEQDALDAVIYAKVLPKLRGENTVRFHRALSSACAILSEHGLARCTAKLSVLIDDLKETGTARFWR